MKQRIASIIRQVCAIGAIVAGCLTAVGNAHVLPVAVSAALVTVGGVIFIVEHFLSPIPASDLEKKGAAPTH